MTSHYARQWTLTPSVPAGASLLNDLEKILRLAPQWNVKSLRIEGSLGADRDFELDVEYDRSGTEISFSGKVEQFIPRNALGIVLTSPAQKVDFVMELTDRPHGRLVSFHIRSLPPPAVSDLREYDLWARSILNYLKISESRFLPVRMWKWFLDRWWLNMTQSGKRITFFIVVSEGFSLVFLVALLLWWKFFPIP